MEAEVAEILLPKNKSISSGDSFPEANFELKSYSSGLKWVFLDYSSFWRAGLSWSIFFLLNIGVPLVSHFVFSCSDCDSDHQRPYDAITQLSLSLFAAISFLSLSSFARKYGLHRFLFLNKLCDESEKVRQGYAQQLHVSFWFSLSLFLTKKKLWIFYSVSMPPWSSCQPNLIFCVNSISCLDI